MLATQHSDGTACTKSSDATVATIVALSSRRRAATVTQRIRRKCHQHGSVGNKSRPFPSSFPLPKLAVAVALPLGCRFLRLRRLGHLGDEWPAVAIVRCPHLSPSSHRRCQGQPHHCRPAEESVLPHSHCRGILLLLPLLLMLLLLLLVLVVVLVCHVFSVDAGRRGERRRVDAANAGASTGRRRCGRQFDQPTACAPCTGTA